MINQELAKFLNCLSDFVVVTDRNDIAVFANTSCRNFFAGHQIGIENRVFRPPFSESGNPVSSPVPNPISALDWTTHTALEDQQILHIGRPAGTPSARHPSTPSETRSKMQVISNISHEMRTPLNGILGMVQLLRDGRIDAFQATCVEAINDAGKALLLLVNDVLDYSKIGSNMLELSEKTFSPALLIERIAELLSPKAFDKGLEFGYYIAPDMPTGLIGDEGRLRQILLNLISNAIKFTAQGGVIIDARAHRHPHQPVVTLKLSVIDTGIGIADDQHDAVFEEFYQADHGDGAKLEGTGLGLAITRSLANMMGGAVSLHSIKGQGSRFTATVTLGLNSVDTSRQHVRYLNKSAPVMILTRSPVLKILLEGQLCNLGVRRRIFAADTPTALELLRKNPEAVLLCDSPEAQAQGDALAAAAAHAIVLLSSLDRNRIDELRADGFDGYLLKPIRQQSLGERLNTYLDRDAPAGRPEERDRNTIAAADAMPDPSDIFAEPPQKRVMSQSCHVLLAEDNRINRILAKAIIERAGFDLDMVENGKEAVSAVRDKAYDVVLMDMHMPVMNGIEAAREIRSLGGAAAATPIIALTANAMQSDHSKCLNAGMNAFLSKPFEPESLVLLIRKWRRPESLDSQAATMAIGRAVGDLP